MFIDDLGMRDLEKGCLPISCIAQERTAKRKKKKKTVNEQTILAQSRFSPPISQYVRVLCPLAALHSFL